MSDKYYGNQTKRYQATVDDHDVELEFDKKLLVVNRSTLRVDGTVVDSGSIVYGEATLTATLDDGVEIEVKIDSGLGGELRHAQVRTGEGAWADLVEREPTP